MAHSFSGRPAVISWFASLWTERLTASGRALFLVGLLIAAVANASYVTKGYFLFCGLACLGAGAIVAARWARVALEVEWSLPERSIRGARIQATVQVRNPTRRPCLDTTFRPYPLPREVGLEPGPGAWVDLVAAGEARTVGFDLELRQRGHYVFTGLRQEGWFPFGLWRDLVLHETPRRLIVYPSFHPLEEFNVPVGMLHHPGGIALSSHVGESTEFIGTREYRSGDSVRHIHWRSWARLGKPVVREFQEEYFCRIALLLDTHVPVSCEERGRAAFEASLSLAAAIADQLGRGEYVVDLFAAGPDLYTMRAGRNLAHLDNVLDVLACLEPCRESPFDRLAPTLLDHLSGITSVVLVLLDWDDSRQDLVRVIREHGPALRVLIVRDGPTTGRTEAVEELAGAVTVLSSREVNCGRDRL